MNQPPLPSQNVLRVANIIEEGKVGGPQLRILQFAKYLGGRVETVVIMPEENSMEFQQLCQNLKVYFKVMPLTRITKEWRQAFRYLWHSPWEILLLVRLFQREKFDLVEVSGGSWQYKGAIAGKLAGIPVLWHLNDSYMPLLFRCVFGILSWLATGYSYASVRTKEYYSPYVKTGRFECTLPTAVDTNWFDPTTDFPPDTLLPELYGKLVIGTVANPSPVKNLETFLRMAAKLQEQSSQPVAFVVVGRIYESQLQYFHFLNNLVQKFKLSLYWAGHRPDVRSLLKRFDVYVCSSKAESSPISVWEAMSMAKPIVSTDVGDVPLYVNDGENGYVVPVEDINQLLIRVLELLSDKSMRERFGIASRRVAKQKLDIVRCGESHLEAYQALSQS